MKQLIALMLLGLASLSQAAPKVAVTDLAYEERVREYIRVVSAQSQVQATGFSASASSSYDEIEGTYSYVERGELRKFTGDIKGKSSSRACSSLSRASLTPPRRTRGCMT